MRLRGNIFVHFLRQDPAFYAFGDFSDFLESITCELENLVKFVVRIHAGEHLRRGPYKSNVRRDARHRAINRGEYNVACGQDRIDFLEPWRQFVPDQAHSFRRELKSASRGWPIAARGSRGGEMAH